MRIRFVADRDLDKSAFIVESTREASPRRVEYGGRALVLTKARTAAPKSRLAGNDSTSKTLCRIGTVVRSTLRLPEDATLHVRKEGSTWVIGPCLGFYVDRTNVKDRPFGEQTKFLADLVSFGLQQGVDVVVLTPGFLDNRVGFRYQPASGQWIRAQVPMPDVVLRRSGTFRSAPAKLVTRELLWLQKHNKLHTLPRVCSNKWQLFQALSRDSVIATYLPPTELASGSSDVYRLSRLWGDVYVKPLGGAQGISVYHLYKSGQALVIQWEERHVPRSADRASKEFRPQTTVKTYTAQSEKEFLSFWQRTNLRRCIVQKTVKLLRTDDGRPFDLRWLVQFTTEPVIAARVARIGNRNAITTNIHTGGKASDAMDVLTISRIKKGQNLLQQADDLALRVARYLCEKYGPYAEAGIDLAIDDDGRVYIFEVNPTPGRRMLRSLGGKAREMSLLYLLEYAIRATGFAGEFI